MSEKHSNNPNIGYLRKMNDSDRTPEFINVREKLVQDVNGWLMALAAKRDAGEPLEDGTIIGDKPRIVTTVLGRTAMPNVNMAVTERKLGVSLTGDGTTTPLKLQAVRLDKSGKSANSIEVQGSDPLARQLAEGEYNGGQFETVMSFKLQTLDPNSSRSGYFGYAMDGDATLESRYLSADGVHTSRQVEKAEDLQLAAEAFENLKSEFGA